MSQITYVNFEKLIDIVRVIPVYRVFCVSTTFFLIFVDTVLAVQTVL